MSTANLNPGILSYAELFSGIKLGSIAIKKVFGESTSCVFHSEINKSCIRISDQHFPGVKNIGDISFLDENDASRLPSFDLLIGGSPCNDLSIARGKREGLDGDQSGLFFAYLDILRIKKPKYFLLENVNSMPEEDKDVISEKLGVEPVMISSVHFTGQERKRLYWCNFPIPRWPSQKVDPRLVVDREDIPKLSLADATYQKKKPKLHNIYFNGKKQTQAWLDARESDFDWITWTRSTRYPEFNTEKERDEFIKTKGLKDWKEKKPKKKNFAISYVEQRITINGPATTLVTGKGCARFSARNLIRHGKKYRPINVKECARLQGIPEGYLDSMSASAKYAAIGNSFTLPVIEHIMRGLADHIKKNEKKSASRF